MLPTEKQRAVLKRNMLKKVIPEVKWQFLLHIRDAMHTSSWGLKHSVKQTSSLQHNGLDYILNLKQLFVYPLCYFWSLCILWGLWLIEIIHADHWITCLVSVSSLSDLLKRKMPNGNYSNKESLTEPPG